MRARSIVLQELTNETFDVLILGGGINGAVSAAALSAQGARVALIDRGDFACSTSQQSSNLAWGGIKYLESLELTLVRKLCRSRNLLLRSYPTVVREIRFLATHQRGFRHSLWTLVLGTIVYWVVGTFFTKRPRLLSNASLAREEPILDLSTTDGGFEYSDAYLPDNDARFVWSFIRSGLDHGASAANYVESLGSERIGDSWTTSARDVTTGKTFTIRSKVLINACGPYADDHNARIGQKTRTRHVFSKGVHLVVKRLTPTERVLTFFADDGRLFFAIPMGNRTCIGTTDTKVGDPRPQVTPEDRRFVLSNINRRLRLPEPLSEADIIAERCGVRPLATSGSSVEADWVRLSRRHVVEANPADMHVSIFGGKLTDCLNVGHEVMDVVRSLGVPLPLEPHRWYGEPPADSRQAFLDAAHRIGLDASHRPSAVDPPSARLWRRYGALATKVLEAVKTDPKMGEVLLAAPGDDFLRAEIHLVAKHEMVTRLEDFLRRRSKIALLLRPTEIAKSPGLKEVCQILFGDQADQQLAEYLRDQGVDGASSPC